MDFYVITYDIPENRPRTKLANLLEDYGKRVQYSVFEIWLTATQMRELYRKIDALLAEEPGQVRFYRLCADCQKTVDIIGGDDLPEPPGVVII